MCDRRRRCSATCSRGFPEAVHSDLLSDSDQQTATSQRSTIPTLSAVAFGGPILVQDEAVSVPVSFVLVVSRQRHRAAPTYGVDRRGRCLPEPTARPAEHGAETHAARIAIGQAAVETTGAIP